MRSVVVVPAETQRQPDRKIQNVYIFHVSKSSKKLCYEPVSISSGADAISPGGSHVIERSTYIISTQTMNEIMSEQSHLAVRRCVDY